MRYSHRIDWSGKDAIGLLRSPFHIPFMSMQIEIMNWSSIISRTIRCLRMRTEMIQDVMRTEMRSGTNSVNCIQWNAHLIWNRSRMGLLNNENDVTNVTSVSFNPCISLQFSTHTMEMEWIYIISSSILSIHWLEWVEFECDHEQ